MKNRSIFLMFAVLFVAFVAVGSAQTSQTPDTQQQPQQQAESEQYERVSGVVEKVDVKKKSITITDARTNESKDYSWSSSTRISRGDKSAKAEDIKKGDRVVLEVDSMGQVVRLEMETSAQPQTQKSDE